MIKSMIKASPRRLRSPAFLLGAIALLSTLLVQSGELGTADTTFRLQTTHSFWTSDPPVFRSQYPEFGLVGRGGRLYSWYGIGQSMLMLPVDIVGTYLGRLRVFDNYDGNDPTVGDIFVSSATNALIALLTALLCYRLLLQFAFTCRQAAAGVLALLFATTHLHYAQNMTENNYILLLTLTGLSFQYEWLRTGRRRALLIGSAALGLNLLTRLTTALDLVACAVFLLVVLFLDNAGGKNLRTRALDYARTTVPVYVVFLLVDRLYQFYRFGSFFSTYLGVFAVQQRAMNHSLPANYPFDGRFLGGFMGPLFAPEKSIFLFDPMLVLGALVTLLFWKRFTPAIRAFSTSTSLLLLAYICFYARYRWWSGDFAWGDRYVSTAVQMAALLAVPLLLRYRGYAGRWLSIVAWALVGASVIIQLASLCFWLPLEIYQMETLGHPTFVIALRFRNIAAFALGKMSDWGLTNHAMTDDPWDYVHITTWNLLPFVLRRVGIAPTWVVNALTLVWASGLAGLVWLFRELRSALQLDARPD